MFTLSKALHRLNRRFQVNYISNVAIWILQMSLYSALDKVNILFPLLFCVACLFPIGSNIAYCKYLPLLIYCPDWVEQSMLEARAS